MKKKRRKASCIALTACITALEGLGSDFALSCAKSLKDGKYMEYLDRKLVLTNYEDPRDFHRDYIALHLLSKWQHFVISGVDREKAAIENFLKSEQICKEANVRIASFDRTVHSMADRLPSIIHAARVKIEATLGLFSWDTCLQYMDFGPGASQGIRRAKGDSFYKFGCLQPTTTGTNAVLASCIISQVPAWATRITEASGKSVLDSFEIVEFDRITTVPKDAKKDRIICIQPLMNVFVQKGIGGCIRNRLKRVGIDLNSQYRNQELARKGSISDAIATVDLKMASDCVSLALVELLLPPDWVAALKACRSTKGVLPDGSVIRYQKVSSMGNGYTFELESLLFWALTWSVVKHMGESVSDVSIFGDDITCPSKCYDELVKTLNWAGFTVNPDKSFSAGPFRESCGKHYFRGRDVTPIYVKDRVDCLERKFWLANQLKRVAFRLCGFGYGLDASLKGAYDFVVGGLPEKRRRPTIPSNFGDGGLIGDLDEVCPDRMPDGIDGWRVWCLWRRYASFHGSDIPVLLKSLYSLEKRSFCNERVSVLDRKNHRKVGTVVPTGIAPEVRPSQIPLARYGLHFVKMQVQRWEDLGPWIEGLNP